MRKFLHALILPLLFSLTLFTQAQILVRTLAGNGPSTAYAAFPGVAVDGFGNVYATDFYLNQIRKITPNGVMTVFAGQWDRGRTDGIGNQAQFYQPIGIDVDAAGNLYVADQLNHLIRKITPDGAVTTFAGSGNSGSSNGTGILAEFSIPSGVALDALGNIYVADTGNNLIRKITPDGVVTTLAGSGQAGKTDGAGIDASFTEASNLTVDASGNVYVADPFNNLIRKITPDGTVTTLAGTGQVGNVDGVGTEASFHHPNGMAVDKDGNLFVADLYNNIIRKITPDGTVSRYVGTGIYGMTNGLVTEAEFGYPSDVAIDASGNMYVSESGNYLIRKISGQPIATTSSIQSLSLITDMKLYPMPASNQLILALSFLEESDLRLELINSEGVKVATTEIIYGSGHVELSLSVQSLPAGMYIANIYSGSQINSQKVVIVR